MEKTLQEFLGIFHEKFVDFLEIPKEITEGTSAGNSIDISRGFPKGSLGEICVETPRGVLRTIQEQIFEFPDKTSLEILATIAKEVSSKPSCDSSKNF